MMNIIDDIIKQYLQLNIFCKLSYINKSLAKSAMNV